MATINYDTAFPGLAAKITPFKAVFNDTVNVTHLRVTIASDNQVDSAVLFWEVLDDQKLKHASATIPIKGDEYKNVTTSKDAIFEFVATKLGITFA